MVRAQERQVMRDGRIAAITAFIFKHVPDQVDEKGLSSLTRLTDQSLHLLAAAIDNVPAFAEPEKRRLNK